MNSISAMTKRVIEVDNGSQSNNTGLRITMMDLEQEKLLKNSLMDKTTNIISAYVSNNSISTSDLPGLMADVFKRLDELSSEDVQEARPEPAVPIKKSITDNHIICLEDGAKLKMLKRYLRTRFDMTPDQYRARWGLPADYPMVAPEYAERRSKFAKKIGLGKAR